MKLGAIVPHLRKYGGIRRFLEFGNEVVKQGYSYTLYVSDMSEEYPWQRELSFKGQIKNIDALTFDELDVCICGDAGSLHYLDESRARLKVVNVIFPPYSTYLLGDYSKFLRRDDLIIVGNSLGWMGPLRSRTNWHTIAGAVNLEMFQPKLVKRVNSSFKVLFLAKNRPWKGLNNILKAYEILKDNKSIKWACFDTETRLELLPADIVFYHDIPQDEMAALYSSFSCFVSMEDLAGWQNCAAEAMACHIPLITTDIGTRDFAIHKKTALIVETVEELVQSILYLKKFPKVRGRMAQKGYEKIQEFSWANYTTTWLSFLEDQLLSTSIELLPEFADQVKSKGEDIDKILNPSTPTIVSIDPMSAIRQRASILKSYYQTKRRAVAKLFDKYERYGAYHWDWESIDFPYKEYIEKLKLILQGIKNFYGQGILLDVGGGDGFLAAQISSVGLPIHMIEVNPTALKLAKEKLGPYPNIVIENMNFFEFLTTDNIPYVLLSQFIEHCEDPKDVISKLKQLEPTVVIISSPLQKPNGDGMWDPDYHFFEWSKEEFINLFNPLRDQYMLSHMTLSPYNQIVVLEYKAKAAAAYLKSILSEYVQNNVDIIPNAIQTMENIFSNKMIEMNH